MPRPESTLTTLGSGKTPLTHISAARQAFEAAQQARAWWLERTRYTVTVSSEDRLWEPVLRWFAQHDAGEEPPRAVAARLRYRDSGGGPMPSEGARNRRKAEIELLYDVKEERKITVSGHQVAVSLKRPAADSDSSSYPREPDSLRFATRSVAAHRAVLDFLNEIVANEHSGTPALYLLSTWGDWIRRDDLPARPLNSVVLADGQMERLTEDLNAFLNDEDHYVRRGIPWHRGYLLHGPPGTGKTSIVRALSAHFGLDLWYVPVGDLNKDASLLSLISRVEPRSILLLEDFDIFRASHERESGPAGAGVTLAGLLNAIDGVATPHGMITVLTTNDLNNVNPAMLRPGRIDLREYVGLPDRDQLVRLWRSFYAEPEPAYPTADIWQPPEGLTTAAAMEAFKRWPSDPIEGIEQVHRDNGPDCNTREAMTRASGTT